MAHPRIETGGEGSEHNRRIDTTGRENTNLTPSSPNRITDPSRATPQWIADLEDFKRQLPAQQILDRFLSARLARLFPEFEAQELPNISAVPYRGLGYNGFSGIGFGIAICPEWFSEDLDLGVIDAVIMHELAELLIRKPSAEVDSIEERARASFAQKLGLPELPELASDAIAMRLMADATRGTNPEAYVRMLKCLPRTTSLTPDDPHGHPEQRIIFATSLALQLELDTSANSFTHAMLRTAEPFDRTLIDAAHKFVPQAVYKRIFIPRVGEQSETQAVEGLLSLTNNLSLPYKLSILGQAALQAIPQSYRASKFFEALSTCVLSEEQENPGGFSHVVCNHPVTLFLSRYGKLLEAVGSPNLLDENQQNIPCLTHARSILRSYLKGLNDPAAHREDTCHAFVILNGMLTRHEISPRAVLFGISLLARQEGILDHPTLGFERDYAQEMLASLREEYSQIQENLLRILSEDLIHEKGDVVKVTRPGSEKFNAIGTDRESKEKVYEAFFEELQRLLPSLCIKGVFEKVWPEKSEKERETLDLEEQYTLENEPPASLIKYSGSVNEFLKVCELYRDLVYSKVGQEDELREDHTESQPIGGCYETFFFESDFDRPNNFQSLAEAVTAASKRGAPIEIEELSRVILELQSWSKSELNSEAKREGQIACYPIYAYALSRIALTNDAALLEKNIEHFLTLFPFGSVTDRPPQCSWIIPTDHIGLRVINDIIPVGEKGDYYSSRWSAYASQAFHTHVQPIFDACAAHPEIRMRLLATCGIQDLSIQVQRRDAILMSELKIALSFEDALSIAFERFADLGVYPGPAVLKELERRAQTPLELFSLRNKVGALAKLRADTAMGHGVETHRPLLVRAINQCSESSAATLLNVLKLALFGECSEEFAQKTHSLAKQILNQYGRLSDNGPSRSGDIRADIGTQYENIQSKLLAAPKEKSGALGEIFLSKRGLLGALHDLRSAPESVLSTMVAELLLGANSPLTNSKSREIFARDLISLLTQQRSETKQSEAARFLIEALPVLFRHLEPEEMLVVLVPPIVRAIKDSACTTIDFFKGSADTLRPIDEAISDYLMSRPDELKECYVMLKVSFPTVSFVDGGWEQFARDLSDTYRLIFYAGLEQQKGARREQIRELILNELSHQLKKSGVSEKDSLSVLSRIEPNRISFCIKDIEEKFFSRDSFKIIEKLRAERPTVAKLKRDIIETGVISAAENQADAVRAETAPRSAATVDHASLTPARLLISFASALGVVGVRAVQLCDQYVVLPEDIAKETSRSYDKLVGLSKLSAWETIKNADPALAKRIARLGDALEGGAFYSVFEAWLVSGDHVAIKVLNPNALPRFKRMIEVCESVCEELAARDKRFEVGKLLMRQVRNWANAEFEAVAYGYVLDEKFRARWHGVKPGEAAAETLPLYVPRTFRTDSTKIWVEEFVPGQNFTDAKIRASADAEALVHTVEIFAQQLLELALTSPKDQGVLVPADWHPGNFRKLEGRTPAVAVLDRQFMLAIGEEEASTLLAVVVSKEVRAKVTAVVEYLAKRNTLGTNEPEARATLIDQISSAVLATDPFEQVRDIAIELARREIELPLTFSLLLKNAHGVARMRKMFSEAQRESAA